jgi:hypothetical protein
VTGREGPAGDPGCSRRAFIGGAVLVTAGVTWPAAAGTVALQTLGGVAGPGNRHQPVSGAAPGAIERDTTTRDPAPPVRRWRCCRTGAELEAMPDGTVRLFEPGSGSHQFALADFSHGQPQELIRRGFGDAVVEELRQALAGAF